MIPEESRGRRSETGGRRRGGEEEGEAERKRGREEDKIVNDRRMKYNYYNNKLVCGRIAALKGTKEAKLRQRAILSDEELAPVRQGCRSEERRVGKECPV